MTELTPEQFQIVIGELKVISAQLKSIDDKVKELEMKVDEALRAQHSLDLRVNTIETKLSGLQNFTAWISGIVASIIAAIIGGLTLSWFLKT